MICVEYFFPKTPVHNDLPEATSLRAVIIPLILGHAITACLGMAFVSVLTFVGQFFYVALLYSIYMTLHTWIVWLYMVLLGLNILTGLFSLFLYDGLAFASYLLILVYFALAILKIRLDSFGFRNLGDREGNTGEIFYLEAGIKHIVNTAKEEYKNIIPRNAGSANNGQNEQVQP